jgi:hypothetical protein
MKRTSSPDRAFALQAQIGLKKPRFLPFSCNGEVNGK